MLVVKGIKCKEKDSALSKEWLETNELGSYAYSTLLSINTSNYHSMLSIIDSSFKRVSVIQKISERFIIGTKNIVVNDKDSDSFLEKYYSDTHSHFIYNFNGVKVLRSVLLLHEKNTLIIKYELLENTISKNVKINLIPTVTGVNMNENSLMDFKNIKFQVIKDEQYVKYSREDFFPVYFYFSNLSFVLNKYDGLNNEGHIIGDFVGAVTDNAPIFFAVSLDRIDVNDIEILYDNEVSRRVELIKKSGTKNELVKNIFLSLNSNVINWNKTEMLITGYPETCESPEESLIALPGILFPLKYYDTAKTILKRFLYKGILLKNYHNNAPLWFIYDAFKYIQYTGDWKFVKDELFEGIEEIMEHYFTNRFENIKLDMNGFLHIVETDEFLKTAGISLKMNILWYNALRIVEILAAKYSSIKYQIKAEEMSYFFKNNFYKIFWNKERGYLNNYVDIPPNGGVDDDLRAEQVLAVSLNFNDLLKYNTKVELLKIVGDELFTSQGLRTLSRNSKYFQQSDIKSGGLSGFYWAEYIVALLKVNKYSKKIKMYVRDMLHKFENNIKERVIGYFPYGLTDSEPYKVIGNPASSLTMSGYMRIFYEELGKL